VRRLIITSVVLVALALSPGAHAATTSVFGGDVSCAAQSSAGDVRLCSGTTHSFDGTKIDVNVILPPAPQSGADGPYPTIGYFHGWGGHKLGIDDPRVVNWATHGYAVFSMTDRGWGSSCGGQDPDRLTPQCSHGYNHLMDDRYEVRDAQNFLGRLADEGVTQPRKIGVTGGSYGGGISMALAALRDRVMLPDGTLTAWTSPNGQDMEIAAAAPDIPWTDLAYALLPNGRTLDYVADAPYGARIGVMKQSFVTGLYATGQASSNYALPGTDPDADLTTWFTLINAGEPYDGNPLTADILDEVESHHSSYYIDHSEPPAPLLISNGWTDDLFPPDEAIRFYNRTRSQYPGAMINLFFSDAGHQRGQNKAADTAVRIARQNAWLDWFLKGEGTPPENGEVETLTQTCPKAEPSSGPYTAASWAELAPGEVRFDGPAAQTVTPLAGDPTRGQAYDPVAGPGACATASGSDQAGTAGYRLAVPEGEAFTLMGSPTVIADIDSPGPTSQLAARLLDVAPSGDATLVARALYRPDVSSGSEATRQVFQLHPNGYRFEAGHIVKLELLPDDVPYGRVSNGQLPVTVSNLELRLPVLEPPNGDLIQSPAPKLLPPGYRFAPGFGPVSDPGGDDDPGDDPGPGGPGAGSDPPGGGVLAGGPGAAPPKGKPRAKAKKCKKKRRNHQRKRARRCRRR
jgi:predicted acyl esterase